MRTARSTRLRLAIAIVAIVVVAALAAVFVAVARSPAANRPPATPTATQVPDPTPSPSLVASPLDGEMIPRRVARGRPLAIIVENFAPDARPQSGLGAASIVYETLAEGGITRFMALYLDHNAPVVGPVRSARPYFVRWAAGYKAIIAHAGGSPAAMFLLYHLSDEGGLIADVNGLLPYKQFYRSSDRLAPHNLYTSSAGVRAIAQRLGWYHPVPYSGFHFKAPAPLHRPTTPTTLRVPDPRPAQRIHISFATPLIGSTQAYDAGYVYDRRRNAYLRSMGGVPHIDRTTGKRIAPANVVVLFMTITPIPGDPEMRVNVANVGRGRALFFHDGRVIHGVWEKRSTTAPVRLFQQNRRQERLDAGQTWIEAVPIGATVRYGP